jgi:hypothetical protein
MPVHENGRACKKEHGDGLGCRISCPFAVVQRESSKRTILVELRVFAAEDSGWMWLMMAHNLWSVRRVAMYLYRLSLGEYSEFCEHTGIIRELMGLFFYESTAPASCFEASCCNSRTQGPIESKSFEA